jgi:hypothetical protein
LVYHLRFACFRCGFGGGVCWYGRNIKGTGKTMNIQEAMTQATAEIMAEKGLRFVNEINDNDCFNWACKVFNFVPGSMIGGHNIDGEGQSYIYYQFRYYDAETPRGVGNWCDLLSFQRMLGGF